jgi:hypothetical protein
VKTAGYGGREIREAVVVHTNDPRNPVMELSDVIYIETDSPIRPKLQVPVFGMITQAPKSLP